MTKPITLSILLSLLFACNDEGHRSTDTKSLEETTIEQYATHFNSNMHSTTQWSAANGNAPVENKKKIDTRKMIWAANLKFQVQNVDSASKAVQTIVEKSNGFISRMDQKSSNYEIRNTIQIRISNDKFNKLINDFKGQALFIDELNIHSNDVTEEYIDIESRLKTKKEVRERYIDVLRNKTGKVSDIIEAEEAIRKITEEIEAKEGRLRYLNNKVSFSTITLVLYQKVDYKKEPQIYKKPYVKKLLEGLQNGWSAITSFLLVLANIWPLLLIAGLIIWKRKSIAKKLKG